MIVLYALSIMVNLFVALFWLSKVLTDEELDPPYRIGFFLFFLFLLMVSWLLIIGGAAYNELENSRAEQVEVRE